MYIDQAKYGGNHANHEKLYFWSRDLCAVKNPLNREFKFKYDSIYWTVPANGIWKKERYLCIRYCELMCQEIIGQMIEERGQKALQDMARTNGNLLLDKYLENNQIWMKMPKQDDRTLVEKIWKDIWLGVVERYGEDRADDRPAAKLDRDSSLYQQLAEQFGSVKFEEVVPAQPAQNTTVISSADTPTASVSDRSDMESEVTVNA